MLLPCKHSSSRQLVMRWMTFLAFPMPLWSVTLVNTFNMVFNCILPSWHSTDKDKDKKKNKKAKKAHRTQSDSKKDKQDTNDNHNKSSQDYLRSTPPSSLSIDNLSTGASKVPPKIKDLPSLCVLMIKEPANVDIPIKSTSPQKTPNAPTAPGVLAIWARWTGNPSEQNMVLEDMDYTFVPPPATRLSDKICISNISMWFCAVFIMVDLECSHAVCIMFSVMAPLTLLEQGQLVQRRMILIQRSLLTHFNNFICIRWLERILALMWIWWACIPTSGGRVGLSKIFVY